MIYKFAAKRGSQVVKVSSAVSLDIDQEQTALNANAATATQPANSQAIKAKEGEEVNGVGSAIIWGAFQVFFDLAGLKFGGFKKIGFFAIGAIITAAVVLDVFATYTVHEDIEKEEGQ